ncbi:hypothetical protein NBRC3280_2896 [Acetobacter pasteurianus NBRC 3280]|uniref:Uncharacterized protein n=1 Tax=Acetobacter pasteurianus NBRC 3278 TaxID=1226660 RepID=A0A401X847_ACEPA|nr:hypothetical protein NBRC3277_2853 [Acetobacter pasteurianus NBRC 3277]GCD63923.1 hypothetical protein NBRC3278_3016 [Acetobacter pasteurianus NBRC 3278]GCD70261.1 hypothetical protein NBRC3280_2896 [Acetobacter pasteurianus NBRC 3280]
MSEEKIERRFEISERVTFHVLERIISVTHCSGAENASYSNTSGRSASFRTKEEAEEYVRLLGGGC